MKTVAFFNNKGGVGKTSLVYHLAWMFSELRVNVVAIDLDPQSNLTASFLPEEDLESLWEYGASQGTILGAVQPLLDRLGDLGAVDVYPVDRRIGLIPGHLGLSLFEDRLAETWGKCLDDNVASRADAFRVTTAFFRAMEAGARSQSAELVLIDVGPNLGAINRAALVAADHVIIPLAADLFSLQGLRNLGPTLRSWRQGWQTRKGNAPSGTDVSIPNGSMQPAGYVVMQPSVHENYPVKAYQSWMGRIPAVYRQEVLGREPSSEVPANDPHALAILKNYRSLAPMAQEVHKPMFLLKAADGAIGGHSAAVTECYRHFRQLALRIAGECHIEIPPAL